MSNSLPARKLRTVAILGAGGGIGAALVRALAAMDRVERIVAASRRPEAPKSNKIETAAFALQDEASIDALAELAAAGGELDLVIVATGVLHDGQELQPEKRLADLKATALERIMSVNFVGPAMVAKHFLPRLAADRPSVFAALSARIGSISDNRAGGWYGYRASKAALNMFIATAAIELRRVNARAACIGLHPGTVDTPLSRPFQARLPAGQLISPDTAARQLLAVTGKVTADDSGGCFAWDGTRLRP